MSVKKVFVGIESLGIGGAERALFDLVTVTHDIVDWTVWCRSGKGVHGDRVPKGVRVLDCSTGRMIRHLEEERPDVFVNNIVQELIEHTPKIRKFVGKMFQILHSPHPWSLQFVDRSIRKHLDGLIVVAPYLVDKMVGVGFPRDRVHVVPNFVDMDVFKPVDRKFARGEVGLPQDKFLFGYFGRADGDKRVHTMPSILKGLRDRGVDAGLVMVGLSEEGQGERTKCWDSVKGMVRKSAEELGVREHMIEVPPVHSPVVHYSALDATILPSVHEGSPVFPIESLSCGVPCVATDVGDLKDFLLPCSGSKIVQGQNMIEPLFVDELFRIFRRPPGLVREHSRNGMSIVNETRSKDRWVRNRERIMKGVFL